MKSKSSNNYFKTIAQKRNECYCLCNEFATKNLQFVYTLKLKTCLVVELMYFNHTKK